MPNPWNDRTWKELVDLSEDKQPRERNPNSSVSAQYEDYLPLDTSSTYEEAS